MWFGLRIGVSAFLFAACLIGNASAAPNTLPAAPAGKIRHDVAATLHRFDVPGAAVMVIAHGRISYVAAFGLRDVAHELPVQTDSFFEIGSITKQFTAAAIPQLQ